MKLFFIVVFIATFNLSFSQKLEKTEVKEVSDKTVRKLLTSLESHSVISGKKLTIDIFKISNGSGSAHITGDDEISETYYFTVTDSPGDEYPIFKVSSIGPFYLSKIISKKDLGDTYILTLEHNNSGKKSVHKIILSLNKVVYQ